MNQTAQDVSQETLFPCNQAFLQAWKYGVTIAGDHLFFHNCRDVESAARPEQLAPNLDKMRKAIQNKGQNDGILIAFMASFYNAEQGQKLLEKCGCKAFGNCWNILDARRRGVIAALIVNFDGWQS